MISKNSAREEVKIKRKMISAGQCTLQSRSIADRLMAMDIYKDNSNIFLYASCRNEVDTGYLFSESIRSGKNVFLPKVSGKDIIFYHVMDMGQLKKGCFGIMEPDDKMCQLTELRSGLFIMPGVAFDEYCNRAGYGAGYYDRYLSGPNEFIKVALAFEFQIYDEIQSEEHDIRPDYIFSENRMIRTE